MALSRSQKDDLVTTYTEGLAEAPHAFLVRFSGLSVNDATELRAKIRESGGTYQVVKNTLALRAIKGKALEALNDEFTGPTAVAFANDDPVSLAKALADFAKDNDAIELKGGILAGRAVGAEQVSDIAKMPTRDELIAKLLFLLQSPITRFVRGLAAIPRDFVIVLDQIAKNKNEG